ncbi:MAG: serine/threonine protein kinase [Labilithrix sp.]|nr:serine/threonine protein kinase [Labilithrix sp.]MCW5817977.1 serine/threonine protein kinase [Labilithrix sp.]
MLGDSSLVQGLLNVLERELLPSVEIGTDAQAWGRANRIADAVLSMLSDEEREAVELPSRVGVLQALYTAARAPQGDGRTRDDKRARASALYTFVTRCREASDPQRHSRPPPPPSRGPASIRPPAHSIVPAPPRNMPAWVPESGVLGGFRLVRPMAEGGLGSLFLAHRLEDEGDPLAPQVVLKVPHDGGALAVHVPEEEMMAAFRAEASALAAIPIHANLARILAFDVASKPKPFLVMELVEGRTVFEELEERTLTMARALEVLDGVLAGLDAMHSVGVGHLDVKPDNVILRRETGAATLVDFGLSGRTVRKKCGNPIYAAPEVWNDERQPESAFAADAYSFACLAFETLTGRALFDDEDPFVTIRQHLSHDGLPPGIAQLRARPELRKLAEILGRALRASPAQRTRVRMIRTELSRLAPQIKDLEWPLRGNEAWQTTPISDLDVSATAS